MRRPSGGVSLRSVNPSIDRHAAALRRPLGGRRLAALGQSVG
jgi:hypothetical protein